MARPARVAYVIMAGGKGERLWPLVRSEIPKVCLPAPSTARQAGVSIDGTHTLLGATLKRIQPLMRRGDALLIVTTAPQAQAVRAVLPAQVRRSLLVEPEGKNTAACIALAAATLAQRDPTSVMAVLPADHWIRQASAFRKSLLAAIEWASTDERIVTIGVRPTRIHPGLGHLCPGSLLGIRHGCRVFHLTRFVEKPSHRVAQRLLSQRRTMWNAGMFIGRVTTFLELMQQWLPHHARQLIPLGPVVGRSAFQRTAASAYRRLRAVSFDDGVMVHLRNGCVVEGDFTWEDLGSWDSWVRIRRIGAPALSIASRNVHVVSPDGHLVAAVGLRDLVVVHTPDATLVCRTQDAQAVRTVVARLAHDRSLSRYL